MKQEAKLLQKKKYIGRILLATGLVLYFTVSYLVLNYFGITCVFQFFLGIPCPGCGMTRAMFSALRLDFGGAFRYHPLFFCLPYVFIYILFDLKGKVHKYILLGIGVLAIVNWLLNVISVSI